MAIPSIQFSDAVTSPPNLTSLIVGTPTGKTLNIGTDPIKITLSWTDSTGSKWQVFETGNSTPVATVIAPAAKTAVLQPLEKGIAHCYTVKRIDPINGNTLATSNSLCSHVQPVISSVTQTAVDTVTIVWTQAAATNPNASPTGYTVERVYPSGSQTEVCNFGSAACASSTFSIVSHSGPLTHTVTVAVGNYVCFEVEATWSSPRTSMDSDKSCIQMISDTTPPVLNLPNNPKIEATGPNGAPFSYTATANDLVDGNVAVTCTPISGSTFALGPTTVNCSAKDSKNNTANGSFTVTVEDTTPPTLNLSDDQTVEATGSTGAPFSYTATANDLVNGVVSVTCTPTSGSTFALGPTTVNCSAKDSKNNTANGSFTVTVEDTIPPVIQTQIDSIGTVTASGAPVSYTATANDLVDGVVSVTCTPTSGSTFALGSNQVDCSATDNSNNTANGSFTVTVEDVDSPVIMFPVLDPVEATGPTGAAVSYTVTANDLVDGDVSVTCTPTSGSTFALGSNQVDCSATDNSNNTANGSFTVTVQDTTPPTLNLSDDQTVEATGSTGALFSYTATANDLVNGVVSVTCTPTSGSTFALGSNQVDCSATDNSNNTANGSFTVTVEDTTPPVITSPSLIRTASTGATTPVSYSVTATDAVTIPVPIVCTADLNPVLATGGNFADGVTQVNCTATDAAGNSSNDSFKVYVSKLTITNEPYSVKWNTTQNLKVDAIGFIPGDVIQVLRDLNIIGSISTSGDADLTQHFVIPLTKFPYTDSGTTVNVNAVLVPAVGVTNYGSDTTGIAILPHATSITTSTFSDGFPGNSASEIGTISDNDDSVQVTGLPITFSVNPANGISGLPQTNSSGITITDNSVLSIVSNNLLVHTDTTITNPSFYQADITFTGLVSGDQLEFVLTPVSGALTPNTQIWTVPTTGDITIPLYFGGGDLIKEIKITKLPNTTAAISNIVIRNSPGDIVHDISFTGSIGAGVTTITENLGRFSSNGTLVSSGVFVVTASYDGSNLAYSASSAPATEFNTQSGVGGSATITADSGMGIAAVACTADGDKDYLCDSWEGTAATDGIPFVVTNYVTGTPTTFYYKLPASSKTAQDIYVESDYMTGHTPDANAVLDVKNLFGTKSIVLHHTIDQVIPHSSFTALWGDTNMVIGDDFNSLKMAYFGSATEHPTLGGTVTVTCTDCATSASSHTLKISGITLQTPSTALTGSTTSGKVTVKATVTLLTNTSAVVHKITSPSVAGTNAAVKIGPLTTSDLTVTGSTAVKTFTITVPFSTVAATGSLVNLGDITIPFTTKATTDVASALTVTTASFTTAGSPRINTSLTDAISQGVHYIPWLHTIGTSTTACGPSGQSEMPGNDGVVSLGCNFATAESGFAYPGGADTRVATVGDRQQQAGTFLHELAHNMGINHGGPQTLLVATTQTNPDATTTTFAAGTSPADSTVNCKPQYTSVMSYARQFPSYLSLAEWTLNLSSGGHSALKESALVETTPVAGTAATLVWGTPTTSPTTLFKKGPTGVGSDWNNNGGTLSGTAYGADINNLGINGCNTASISTTASYDWNDWANLDFNLRKATGGQLDGLLGEETPEVVKQANIFSGIFNGFYNPPPYDDASKNLVSAATTPLKIKITSQSGDTLVVKLRGEYRFSTAQTPQNTYTKMVCNNNSGKDSFVLKDTFNQCDWKIPSVAKGTTIYIKIWLDTEGGTPSEILLVDQSPPVPTPAGGFPYKDQNNNIVTNYVKIK